MAMDGTLQIVIGAVCYVIFFVGIVGNSTVLFVLLRQRNTWTISTMYLFNLAIADTVFLLFIPFWGHYYLNGLSWIFGLGMCKLVGAVTYINMYASILFLTAMSIDRWLAIVHATRMHLMRKVNIARAACFIMWCIAILLSWPSFTYRDLRFPRKCYMKLRNPSSHSPANETFVTTSASLSNINTSIGCGNSSSSEIYQCQFFVPYNESKKSNVHAAVILTRSILGFIIPMTVIVICYVQIVITVKKKVISRKVKKDRIAKLAVLVIGAFFFCWLPYHFISIYSALGGWLKLFHADSAFYYAAYPIATCLAYANSFVNPIVYAFTTTKFQENMKDMCNMDRSAKPYRMTLKSGGRDKTPKTTVVHLNTPRSSPDNLNRSPCLQEVEVHEVKETKEVELEEAQESLPVEPSITDEQTFSFYSSPAVMEGLNKATASSFEQIAPYSAPEVDECDLSLIRNEV